MADRLKSLYHRISACHVCPHMDPTKERRCIDAVRLPTDVMIISEALAPEQLRQSGVNFFQADGQVGSTGNGLEPFLNEFGCTIYPATAISLSGGVTIPACATHLIPVYNTEVAQCFPGWEYVPKKGKIIKKIRSPEPEEVRQCLAAGFLNEEIDLIRPKLILLMGATSYGAFLGEFLNMMPRLGLVEHIKWICENDVLPYHYIGGRKVAVLPIVHFSGSARGYWAKLDRQRIIDMIKEQLR